MNTSPFQIPQGELDKLNDAPISDMFPSDEQEEQVEQVVEVKPKEEVSVSPEEDTVADEARIPYSRFEKVNERAIKAEERLKVLEEQFKATTETKVEQTELPAEWVELYGDSEAAQRAYQLQLQREERLQEQLIEKIESKRKEEKKAEEEGLAAINQQLEEFQKGLGRKLSDTEEKSILDIQDEFTQKDKDGNYLTQLLSPEKAFEIYTLRQEKTVQAKKQAKNRVVALTGANDSEQDTTPTDNFQPNAWGSWRDKI